MDSTAAAQAHEHNFPERAWEYVKIGLVLFVLTAMEVGAYEIAHREGVPLHDFMHTALIPVLIVLSGIKFALVALFYMHLKSETRSLKMVVGLPMLFPALYAVVLIIESIARSAFT